MSLSTRDGGTPWRIVERPAAQVAYFMASFMGFPFERYTANVATKESAAPVASTGDTGIAGKNIPPFLSRL